ncbi:MAG TPA: membrane-bound lytic murein transglycosylase MltF [Burkholderiales bacterium]|nr:membrane-bound lytic murein transglycosylase MltF [Burkholderiales bacterium]
MRDCCNFSAGVKQRARRITLPGVLFLFLTSCNNADQPVPPVGSSGELVVITRESPTTLYTDPQGHYAGLEFDFVSLFAQQLGVKFRFVTLQDFSQTLPALLGQKAHLAAAGLAVTSERKTQLAFSVPYQTIQQQVVYNTDTPKPKGIPDLIGKKIEVVAGSNHAEMLREIAIQYPRLKWTERSIQDSEELLGKVANGTIDYALADSNLVEVAKNYYPNIEAAFDLGQPQQLAWAFPGDAEPWLMERANDFFARIAEDGTLKRLLDRYYGHLQRLNQNDVGEFLEKRVTVLPRYRSLFQEAQKLSGIDWRLLAALSYQESHWNPLATSPTGVRGLMMLTYDTADQMKVTDRLDPEQNISAGARYLVELKSATSAHIKEPDRSWIALAAYNVGFSHLEDARILAQRQKLDPDSWLDLKKTLPLLSRRQYYSTLKHGFARGGEPVIFVENVKTYYDILVKYEAPLNPAGPGLTSDFSITPFDP